MTATATIGANRLLGQSLSAAQQPETQRGRDLVAGMVPSYKWGRGSRLRVEDAVWNSLPLAKLGERGKRSPKKLEWAYQASLQSLQSKANQLRRFAGALARMNTEDRSAGQGPSQRFRKRILRERWRLFVENFDCPTPRFRVCTQDISRLSPAECYEVFAQAARRQVSTLVSALFDMLEDGVKKGLVGRIEWTTPQTCRFNFFREVVISNEDVRKELRDGKVVWTGTHTYRHAVHLHEVTEAVKHPQRPEGLFVPERVGSAMHLVPRWLRPHLCWVTGTQVRDRVVERDLRTEKWEYADPSPRAYEQELRRRDPAIVFEGGFVLTGWGVLDKNREAASPLRARGMRPDAPWWVRLLALVGLGR
jgi:hypothetical protein